MAVFYALGNALVSNDEMRARGARGELSKFRETLKSRPKAARLDLWSGRATADNILRAYVGEKGAPIKFQEIGIGKPLTIQLRHVYTGDKAKGFWGDKDMLVTSSMKSIATYDAAPRAINFLEHKTKNNRNFRTVDATSPGTSLICYSPALAQSSSVVTVEIIFDGFPKGTFDAVAQAFGTAAGLPVFAPASGYLVAASILTKLVGDVGKSLSTGTPALKRTEEITFVTPGSDSAMAGFALLIADDVEASLLNDYKVNDQGMLVRVDDEKHTYDGPHPYAVISLDGRANGDFEKFAPTAATAAQLDRFYNIKEGGSNTLNQLTEGLKLYNDMTFRDKAMKAKERLTALAAQGVAQTSDEYKDTLAHYNAYVANIGNKDLKP